MLHFCHILFLIFVSFHSSWYGDGIGARRGEAPLPSHRFKNLFSRSRFSGRVLRLFNSAQHVIFSEGFLRTTERPHRRQRQSPLRKRPNAAKTLDCPACLTPPQPPPPHLRPQRRPQHPKTCWRLSSRDEPSTWRRPVRPKPTGTTARPECTTVSLR